MKLFLRWIFCFGLGFVAECKEKLYGLKGRSISLSIGLRNQSQLQDVVWRRFNRQQLLANMKGVHPDFENRISLNNSDWSLTIHNLQEGDTGLYEALDYWEKESLAAFNLSVENNISEPVIKVNKYDHNSSSGVCRATVNCSADGNWAKFDCDQHHCQEKQTFLTSVSITVTASDSIHCHVKNHVSERHSQTPIMCHEKQQSVPHIFSPVMFWIAVTAIVCVLLVLFGVVAIFVKRRKCSKVHPQSSRVVIEQHNETIYSTVEKPASQTSPVKNPVSNKVETIYDTPSRHTKACQVDSVEVRRDDEEQQQSGQDRTIQVKATVHQAAEPDSDPLNTVYCKLGEI